MNIQTHYTEGMADDELPWIAVDVGSAIESLADYDLTEKEKTELPSLLMGYCNLIEQLGLVGFGKTENDAISDLISKGEVAQ